MQVIESSGKGDRSRHPCNLESFDRAWKRSGLMKHEIIRPEATSTELIDRRNFGCVRCFVRFLWATLKPIKMVPLNA